ncbi:MAG: Maltose/maltodextrin ABC transporter, permease protein MalF [Anaerolineae bacterium]|jgi:ABC-type sugar transport system permease subunit|nr:MAG: Maltose/maltodextrin ABC transporter, permease protein MalF [Anaerolineae bacterium]
MSVVRDPSIRRKAKLWDRLYPYVSVLIPVSIIALFTIYPVLYALRISFYQYILTKPKDHPFVGLDNYIEVITSYYFRNSLLNTAIYTTVAVTCITLFGLGVALLLNSKLKTANALKVIILLPWAIPAVVGGLIWKWILNSDFGILNGILYALGIIDQYIPFLANPNLAKVSLILAAIWKEGPLAVIFFLSGLQLIPNELYEAARIDGGSSWKIFRHITLPLLKPILLIVIIYETITAILVFDLIYVMTGGGPGDSTSMISWFAYAEIFKNLNLGHGVALAVIIALMILALILAYLRIIRYEENVGYS